MKTHLAMYQALISINVAEPKAEAVIKALESDLITLLATKSDIATVNAELVALRGDVKTDMAALRSDLKSDLSQLELKLSIRMGFIVSTIVGLMFAGMKYLP